MSRPRSPDKALMACMQHIVATLAKTNENTLGMLWQVSCGALDIVPPASRGQTAVSSRANSAEQEKHTRATNSDIFT